MDCCGGVGLFLDGYRLANNGTTRLQDCLYIHKITQHVIYCNISRLYTWIF